MTLFCTTSQIVSVLDYRKGFGHAELVTAAELETTPAAQLRRRRLDRRLDRDRNAAAGDGVDRPVALDAVSQGRAHAATGGTFGMPVDAPGPVQ